MQPNPAGLSRIEPRARHGRTCPGRICPTLATPSRRAWPSALRHRFPVA